MYVPDSSYLHSARSTSVPTFLGGSRLRFLLFGSVVYFFRVRGSRRHYESPPLFDRFRRRFRFLFPGPFILVGLLSLFPIVFRSRTFRDQASPFLGVYSVVHTFLFLRAFLRGVSPRNGYRPRQLLLNASRFPMGVGNLFFNVLILHPRFGDDNDGFRVFLGATWFYRGSPSYLLSICDIQRGTFM